MDGSQAAMQRPIGDKYFGGTWSNPRIRNVAGGNASNNPRAGAPRQTRILGGLARPSGSIPARPSTISQLIFVKMPATGSACVGAWMTAAPQHTPVPQHLPVQLPVPPEQGKHGCPRCDAMVTTWKDDWLVWEAAVLGALACVETRGPPE